MSTNSEVVGTAYAAFSRRDIPAIIDLLDDDVVWSSPATLPQGGEFTGKDGAVKFFEGLGAAWESLVVENEVVGAVRDDLVVSVVTASGSLREGGDATLGAVHVFTVDGGKITRFREYTDVDEVLGT